MIIFMKTNTVFIQSMPGTHFFLVENLNFRKYNPLLPVNIRLLNNLKS